MKALSLNCQKGYQPGLKTFLQDTLSRGTYDALLLQEVSDTVREYLTHPEYRLLTAVDEVIGKKSMLCIVYREDMHLSARSYQSFSGLRFDPVVGYKHLGFGVLGGSFTYKGSKICLFSTHLHSGIDSAIRVKELRLLKEQIRDFVRNNPLVVGGDFNFGYPWELLRACRILAPEFLCVTHSLGGTLNSRYSELVNHLPNKVAHALARFGLGITLKADHFFVDQISAKKETMYTHILPDRVSDHSPIELLFE